MVVPMPGDFVLPFLRKEQAARDVYSFYFDRSSHAFDFLPGQYIKLTVEHPDPDLRGISRNFSIASSPNNKNELMITTKVVQSTFKKAFFNLTPGTECRFFGPVGRFVFNEEETAQHVLFAGGIGVTPYHSMLRYIAEKNITIPVTLFASFTIPEDFLYFQEFSTIANTHPTVKIVYSVTHPEESKVAWNGETGRISSELIQKYVPDISQCITMTCGPVPMVTGTIEMLTGIGVAPENLRKENFTGY